jgi:hypothetical protein
MRRVNPELTRESPRFISARRPPIGRFRSSPIRLIFLSPLVFLPASILVRAPARRAQFHSRAGPDSAARGVRSPGSDRRDRLASHTNIRWVAVPCWPVFRRDCPNFFVTIASACRRGAKGIGGGSGIASSSPGPSAPPSDAEATTSPSNRRGAVSSDSRIVPAAAREGTVGLTSSPRASDSRPGDSFYQQRQRLRWRARRRARTRRAPASLAPRDYRSPSRASRV